MSSKKDVKINDYAGQIIDLLPQGLLLNTNGEKFDSMIIGWGHLGVIWGRPTFHAYVRTHRFTKKQLDETGEFTISVPVNGMDKEIFKLCGTLSGWNLDKAEGVTLEEPRTNHTPGVREYPLTIECKILYSQEMPLDKIPEDICAKMYPQDVDSSYYRANCDPHTMYVGEIVDAYLIEEE